MTKSVSLEDVNGLEHIHQMGVSLDELARHQPALRPIIMSAIINRLECTVSQGREFVPSQEERADYSYDSVVEPRTVSNGVLVSLTRVCKVSYSQT